MGQGWWYILPATVSSESSTQGRLEGKKGVP